MDQGSEQTVAPHFETSVGALQEGRVLAGTPAYASPEHLGHLRGDPDIRSLDPRSDLYSVGVLAFNLLTGQLPREATPSIDLIHSRAPVRKIRRVAPKTPRALARFVDTCLEFDREQRYANAESALRDLTSSRPWWRLW